MFTTEHLNAGLCSAAELKADAAAELNRIECTLMGTDSAVMVAKLNAEAAVCRYLVTYADAVAAREARA